MARVMYGFSHSFIVPCEDVGHVTGIPQLPDRCPQMADGNNGWITFNFRSTVSETILQAKYRQTCMLVEQNLTATL